MNTPICDFVKKYAESEALRLHMPGHKGQKVLGLEHLDITEIDGADSLYEASGIIRESEDNASRLFGCPTFYSTEGSSQCIRAMLYLAALGRRPVVAAGRNAHKTFLSAAALLDLEVHWLVPEETKNYLSCPITPEYLDHFLENHPVTAVYVTSPDYLGNVLDIQALACVCHAHGVLLLVDNAHGAYLRFLPESRHPMDLGADLCCDSAHKTLPVLTGGAYLHVGEKFASGAKNALALFGSTSPSYLILQSLDAANVFLASFSRKIEPFLRRIDAFKRRFLTDPLRNDEPLKLTLDAKAHGYYGQDYARLLLEQNVVCEFADRDHVVFMLSPDTDLDRLEQAMAAIPRREPIQEAPPAFHRPERAMSVRQAAFSPCETIPVSRSVGRILAAASVGCPPAVPIVVCGEIIDEAAVRCFQYYGIETCTVVKSEDFA